jgi:hypothetical protein
MNRGPRCERTAIRYARALLEDACTLDMRSPVPVMVLFKKSLVSVALYRH